MRKSFIDNLRWMDVFLLIPYHAAQAFNTWGEPNYIVFSPNRPISSFIVFFSPFFMPLLFLLAGMSTRYALQKRSFGQYLSERCKRLLIPFVLGTVCLCPILAYIGDKTNHGYDGGFVAHYGVFFTKWTDLTGADGGFNVGQFWFLLYLFVISLVSAGIIAFTKQATLNVPFWGICLMVIPLPFLHDLLAIGGKSVVEYFYIFLFGFYVLSQDEAIEAAAKYRFLTLSIGLAAAIANVYLFVWSGCDFDVINTIVRALAEWFMMLSLIGIGRNYLDRSGKITACMSRSSFLFYCLHFVWVVLFQYLFSGVFAGHTVLLFFVPVICAYAVTLLCAVILPRIIHPKSSQAPYKC